MTEVKLEIREHDEAGNVTATYVQSSYQNELSRSRVDIVWPDNIKTVWQRILDIFLPAGYPQSVTEDYLPYQIYDSLQAFSSAIAGLISSRAVLEGVGVGDASASPTAALLLSIVQESMGRVATILFAHRLGTSLEPECKMYRLAADVFNDTAMILDCLSPAFPKAFRVLVLSCSSVLRALCGVAAGSSKASLSAHFARWENLGELNAKDSSQETIISLLGMLAGSVVVSIVSSKTATWSTLMLLLAVHLATNHAAVRAVTMRSLNRQRANIVFSTLVDADVILTPKQVSERERIFEADGVLRWGTQEKLGYCRIGVSMQDFLKHVCSADTASGSFQHLTIDLLDLLNLFNKENYLLWYNVDTSMATAVVKQGATPLDLLKAWTHALLVARRVKQVGIQAPKPRSQAVALSMLHSTLVQSQQLFEKYTTPLRGAGWDLDIAALETKSGRRIACDSLDSQ